MEEITLEMVIDTMINDGIIAGLELDKLREQQKNKQNGDNGIRSEDSKKEFRIN